MRIKLFILHNDEEGIYLNESNNFKKIDQSKNNYDIKCFTSLGPAKSFLTTRLKAVKRLIAKAESFNYTLYPSIPKEDFIQQQTLEFQNLLKLKISSIEIDILNKSISIEHVFSALVSNGFI